MGNGVSAVAATGGATALVPSWSIMLFLPWPHLMWPDVCLVVVEQDDQLLLVEGSHEFDMAVDAQDLAVGVEAVVALVEVQEHMAQAPAGECRSHEGVGVGVEGRRRRQLEQEPGQFVALWPVQDDVAHPLPTTSVAD